MDFGSNTRSGTMVLILISIFLCFGFPVQVRSQSTAPELGLPLICKPGSDCWVVNFVDLDPGKGVRDHSCGAFSYNGHKGTDISVRDLKAMQAGVPVIASAPGLVLGVRDGMADVDLSVSKNRIAGRECGNGVVIAHGGGWETQYCHMKKGSVSVKKGVRVKRGHQLGLVGLSGKTQFPHVHLSVRHNKRVIDPYTGVSPGDKCGTVKKSLWFGQLASQLNVSPSAIFSAGFAAKRPAAKSIRAGLYKDSVLSRSAPVLLLWADVFWAQKGDVLQMQIFGPDGELVHEYKGDIDKTRARQLFYAGKKRKPLFWPTGEYRGEITLLRPNGGETSEAMKAVRRVTLK